jgi:hypothetical protein
MLQYNSSKSTLKHPYDSSQLSKLTAVQPLPVELEDTPETPNTNSTKTLRRILSGLFKVQKYSAYVFGAFLGIHVTSVVLVPSVSDYIIPLDIKQEIFEMSRSIYHSIPFVEKVMILGASVTHIISGIGIRITRNLINRHRVRKYSRNSNSIVDEKSDEIGLGGITAILGLGYRKSIISKLFPTLTPLSFSGYILIPLLAFHFLKFRYLPIQVDGDSNLINLDYISYYLNHSVKKFGNFGNLLALFALVWTMSYHSVSGWLRFNSKYSWNWKRLGYLVISLMSLLSLISIFKFKHNYINLDKSGFIGKSFLKYLSSILVNDYI